MKYMTPEHNASSALVLRVNELFHDLEGAAYADVHPEIFERERERWDTLLAEYVTGLPRPLRCLDVGCGTGFVSERLLQRLHSGDSLVCADISQTMLDICRKRFGDNPEKITINTLKLAHEHLDLENSSVDVVMMNSVLHHVPNSGLFLAELSRVLAPGGLLMIGHEPNNLFWRNAFLRKQYALLHALTPKRMAAALLKKIGLYGRAVIAKKDTFLDELNARLLEEGTISEPLTRTDLSRLVDVHSPTAGGLRLNEGFDPYALLKTLPFEMSSVFTYNHLSKISGTRFLLRPYEALLAKVLPGSGSTFFLVARKRSDA